MSSRALSLAVVLAVTMSQVSRAAPPLPQAEAVAPAAVPADPVGAHAAIAQAQERLAEIDATISVLQDTAEKADAATREKARDAVAGLRAIRDTYRKEIEGIVAQGRQLTADQIAVARTALAAPWTQFQQALDRDVVAVKLDAVQRKALIEARLKAEQSYWQSVLTDLQASAAALTAEQRAAIDARIGAVRAHVEAAQTRLSRLGRAGQSAWSALKQGFINSRQIFDEAYHTGQ